MNFKIEHLSAIDQEYVSICLDSVAGNGVGPYAALELLDGAELILFIGSLAECKLYIACQTEDSNSSSWRNIKFMKKKNDVLGKLLNTKKLLA